MIYPVLAANADSSWAGFAIPTVPNIARNQRGDRKRLRLMRNLHPRWPLPRYPLSIAKSTAETASTQAGMALCSRSGSSACAGR